MQLKLYLSILITGLFVFSSCSNCDGVISNIRVTRLELSAFADNGNYQRHHDTLYCPAYALQWLFYSSADREDHIRIEPLCEDIIYHKRQQFISINIIALND